MLNHPSFDVPRGEPNDRVQWDIPSHSLVPKSEFNIFEETKIIFRNWSNGYPYTFQSIESFQIYLKPPCFMFRQWSSMEKKSFTGRTIETILSSWGRCIAFVIYCRKFCFTNYVISSMPRGIAVVGWQGIGKSYCQVWVPTSWDNSRVQTTLRTCKYVKKLTKLKCCSR